MPWGNTHVAGNGANVGAAHSIPKCLGFRRDVCVIMLAYPSRTQVARTMSASVGVTSPGRGSGSLQDCCSQLGRAIANSVEHVFYHMLIALTPETPYSYTCSIMDSVCTVHAQMSQACTAFQQLCEAAHGHVHTQLQQLIVVTPRGSPPNPQTFAAACVYIWCISIYTCLYIYQVYTYFHIYQVRTLW